jgi:hypothetical protein
MAMQLAPKPSGCLTAFMNEEHIRLRTAQSEDVELPHPSFAACRNMSSWSCAHLVRRRCGRLRRLQAEARKPQT